MTTKELKENKSITGFDIRLGQIKLTEFLHKNGEKTSINFAVQHSYKKDDKWVNNNIYLSLKNLRDLRVLINTLEDNLVQKVA